MTLSSRIAMEPQPKRPKQERSSKIIFFSCEGPVTEEIYFRILSEQIFYNISSKICLVSAREEFLNTPHSERTQEQVDEQNRSSPKYVLERLEKFKRENNDKYEFDKHEEDEFWIVIDVDDHIAPKKIVEFKSILKECHDKKIQYAVTNPFFEFWLYLHFFDVCEEDKKHANCVGDDYFRKKMAQAGIRLSGNDHKKPNPRDYNPQNVSTAVKRAEALHINKNERWPEGLGSHVYKLVSKFIELMPST